MSDISYIATREGWLYLAVVLDLFSRKIVGFSMSSRMQTDLVKRALQQAIMNRNPERGFIHHSDRDSQ
ncbi:MAG: DDE-type integrase/transposase/recombinase [Candidatus Rhabdochlamydia oedothoracis]|nr:DDE-type integrase/transposase/recombinase [Candidatus Rhabdochlamydia oedothoracis]